MNINKFVLSIVKRPSFNLLAFQGLIFFFFLFTGELIVQELAFVGKWEYDAVRMYQIIYTFILGMPAVLYTLIFFIINLLCRKYFFILWNKYTIIFHFFILYILFSIFMLPIDYDFSGAPGLIIVFLFLGFILSIIAFSIIPLIIIFIIEQIRGIRIENLSYINNKFKLAGVIFCALFPVVVLGTFAIYLLILI